MEDNPAAVNIVQSGLTDKSAVVDDTPQRVFSDCPSSSTPVSTLGEPSEPTREQEKVAV